MGAPKLIPGGDTGLVFADGSSTDASGVQSDNRGTGQSMGQFSRFPGATKKFAINDGVQRDNEYRDTMARMFIEMQPGERELFVNSLPPETQALGKILAGADTGGSNGTGFIDFLLQDIQESFNEKYQIVETLSDNFVVYMFGQSAPVFQYSGVLLNTYQDDQRVWMMRLYRDVLRGTQLARRRKLVRFRYDSVIVSGIMLNMNMSLRAGEEDRSPFSFTLIPMSYVIFTEAIGVPTQLDTPFTEGAQFGLPSAGTFDSSRLRVVGVPAAPAEATRTRANEPNTDPLNQALADTVTMLTAPQVLANRGVSTATPVSVPSSNQRNPPPAVIR